MEVTKLEHAALRVGIGSSALIIDPGGFTLPLDDLDAVVAVVLTHEHPDHWSTDHLRRIREAAGDIPVFGPAGVAAAAGEHDITVMAPGDTVTVEPFTLRFFGGEHAPIHDSVPIIDNVGVLVNDEFYYPGDSYAVPEGVEVQLLAAPLGAPWLKIHDAIEFVLEVAPRHAFGTHDMTLSQIGKDMHRSRLRWATEQGGGEFHELEPGESVVV